jgi:pimeloyl-ACP methyl ester carboxylesterase
MQIRTAATGQAARSVRRALRSTRAIGRSVGPAIGLGVPRLVRHPVWGSAQPAGSGVGVVVVPGFAGTDASMVVLRRWLTRLGHRPVGARLRLNIGCTSELVERLERRIETHVKATGGPVVLLGHSRGGWLCRLVAVRRPELVRGVVMVGSPVLDPLDAHGWVMAALRMVVGLSARGVPGLLEWDCLNGGCRERTERGLAAPLSVPALAIYSRDDGVVGWQSCQDPAAEWVEVDSSHNGYGTDPAVYTAVAARLAMWTAKI